MHTKYAQFLKTILSVSALVTGTFITSGCPTPTQNEAEALFTFNAGPSASPSAGLMRAVDRKTWRTAVFVDPQTVQNPSPSASVFSTAIDTNSVYSTACGGAANYYLPLSGAFDSASNAYLGMINVDPATVYTNGLCATVKRHTAFLSTALDFGSDLWALDASFATFTGIGQGIAFSSTDNFNNNNGVFWTGLAPDGVGNMYNFIAMNRDEAGANHLYVAKHNAGASTIDWTGGIFPTRLSTTAYPVDRVPALDLQCAPRVTADGSGNLVALWYSSTAPYLMSNTYRTGVGWLALQTTTVSTIVVGGTTYTNVPCAALAAATDTPSGFDVGLDGSGNGWAVFPMQRSAGVGDQYILVARRYISGTGFTGVPVILATSSATLIGAPRIWMRSDGSASVFYYVSSGAGDAALYNIEVTAAGSWGTAMRIDNSSAASLMRSAWGLGVLPLYQGLAPQLAFYGIFGALAFVELSPSDNQYHLYVSLYDPLFQVWQPVQAIDESVVGVGWFSMAAGPVTTGSAYAQFVFGYEGLSSASASTGATVHARTYNTKDRGFTSQANLSSGLSTSYSFADARPTALASQSGRAAVGFFISTGGVRRALLSSFR